MNIKDIRIALKTGKAVSNKDYDTILETDGHSKVISYLAERFNITKNPNIGKEIKRLKSIISHPVNKGNSPVAGDLSHKANKKVSNTHNVDEHLNFRGRDTKTEIRQSKYEPSHQSQNASDRNYHKPDHDRHLYVHHDNEPYVDRNINIPAGDKEREDYLLEVSLDNWDLYEFLKDEHRRQKKYK